MLILMLGNMHEFNHVLYIQLAGDTPEHKKKKIGDSGYGSGSKMANAVLKVECQELHVNKEVRVML